MKIKFKPEKGAILKLLKTSNIDKKLKIFDRLNELTEKDRIKILLKILEDSSWMLREKAAYTLAAFGSRVVPRLKKLSIRGYWYTRAAACLALGEIGNAKALDEIVSLLLTDTNPTVLHEASNALLKLVQTGPDQFCEWLRAKDYNEAQEQRILNVLKIKDASLFHDIQGALHNE